MELHPTGVMTAPPIAKKHGSSVALKKLSSSAPAVTASVLCISALLAACSVALALSTYSSTQLGDTELQSKDMKRAVKQNGATIEEKNVLDELTQALEDGETMLTKIVEQNELVQGHLTVITQELDTYLLQINEINTFGVKITRGPPGKEGEA